MATRMLGGAFMGLARGLGRLRPKPAPVERWVHPGRGGEACAAPGVLVPELMERLGYVRVAEVPRG